jgi:alpha-galactosidase
LEEIFVCQNPSLSLFYRTPFYRFLLLLVCAPIAASTAATAPSMILAPTPPMGWNSWNSFAPAVRENEVKANADGMSAKLAKFGWQYVVVDIE